MEDLADRLLIVVGGASGDVGDIACARSFRGWLFGRDGVGDLRRVLGGSDEKVRRGRGGTRRLVVFFADVERFLDRRQRGFGRVVHFFRVVGHFGRRLACYACPGRPNRLQALSMERSDVIFGPRGSAGSVTVRSLRDSPKKPHASPPAGILSVWQIKENPVGNDLLTSLTGLMSLPHFADRGATAIVLTTMRPGWGRPGHSRGFAADKWPAGALGRKPVEPCRRNIAVPAAVPQAQIVDRWFPYGQNYLYRFRRCCAHRRGRGRFHRHGDGDQSRRSRD